MVTRTFNPRHFDGVYKNERLNNADFDPKEWLDNRDNIALYESGHLAMFEYEYSGVYTGHVFSGGFDFGPRALRFLFDTEPVEAIRGVVPEWHRPSRLYVRKLGFKSYGVIETVEGPHELFILTKEEFNGRSN